MSSIEAFGARRVRESLRSIGRYLDSATHLAEGIPPGETVRLDLEAPGPRLRSLHEKTGTRKIKLPIRAPATPSRWSAKARIWMVLKCSPW